MKRSLIVVAAIAVLAITVAQVKGMRPPQRAVAATVAKQTPAHVAAEGRVVTYPGAEVTIGSEVAGTIERVAFEEKDLVRKGDVIATIRADDKRASIAEAKARIAEAEADIRLFGLQSERAKRLFGDEVGSREAWEKCERDLDAARARRASAAAEVGRLEAELAKTIIRSPIDGCVITRPVHPGESIASGAAIMTIANLGSRRIEAEVDEFDSGRMKIGAPAEVSAEGFPATWRAHVEEIPDSVVSSRLKPQDTSRPTDTRVLLVKLALDEEVPLKLGQRVEVRIGRSGNY